MGRSGERCCDESVCTRDVGQRDRGQEAAPYSYIYSPWGKLRTSAILGAIPGYRGNAAMQ